MLYMDKVSEPQSERKTYSKDSTNSVQTLPTLTFSWIYLWIPGKEDFLPCPPPKDTINNVEVGVLTSHF